MGAWGYGYNDNDNYYNLTAEFTEPLIDALNKRVASHGDTQDLRAHLMWVANVLMGTKEEVSLSRTSVSILRNAVHVVRGHADAEVDSWRKPDEYREAVGSELAKVEDWLDTFAETGLLGDRIVHLMAAEVYEENL